jgi:hydrogenase maturation protease
MPRILLIGYGNPGRLDDGLGPAFAEAVEALGLPCTVESDYQLAVEDAYDVAQHDVVVFADADRACEPPFRFEPIGPKGGLGFSSHSLSPEGVMAIAVEHFGAGTRAFVLGIRGYEFDALAEGLTEGARRNLEAAVTFFEGWVGKGSDLSCFH